jgi:predicted dithiol-disulfide oxidoreductase (DUF899 family)
MEHLSYPHLSYPNETAAYRKARNDLLDAEMALRVQLEAVAAQRRALPPGGETPEDYVFERIGENRMPEKVKMSALFGAHNTLILYSFMYGPDVDAPCSGCTNLLDSIDGAARHIGQRATLWIVAKSPIARLVSWAKDRGWGHLRFVSTAGNTFDADYFGDTSKLSPAHRKAHGVPPDKNWDETIFNVFRMDNGVIRHFWGSELSFAPAEPHQNHRSGDLTSALWALLDMTPEGRGAFFPKLTYD